MPIRQYRHSRIAPLLVVGAAAALTAICHPAAAQAFVAAGSSLSHYSNAKLTAHLTCPALGEYRAKELVNISAVAVAATAGVPAHCRVTGVLFPEIAFEVSLPAHWNGRFYMIGNGGHAGESLEDPMRVAQRRAPVLY